MKLKKFAFWMALLISIFCILDNSHAAPCYGTKMPQKKGFFTGLESYTIFKRDQENDFGKLRSAQYFVLVSYGVYDWFSIDLKAGGGNIKQNPAGRGEIDYSLNFAGGYGLRLRLYDKNNIKMVFGFQHISVHPKSTRLGNGKNRAILDDWQVSLLLSQGFGRFTPYLGTRWSRVDYIHRINTARKRIMSDLTKSAGLIFGCDFAITDKIRLNLEGSCLDSQAFAFSLNFAL